MVRTVTSELWEWRSDFFLLQEVIQILKKKMVMWMWMSQTFKLKIFYLYVLVLYKQLYKFEFGILYQRGEICDFKVPVRQNDNFICKDLIHTLIIECLFELANESLVQEKLIFFSSGLINGFSCFIIIVCGVMYFSAFDFFQ